MRHRQKPKTRRLRLRKLLRRQDADWVNNIRPKLLSWGYVLPMTNKEVKRVLASPEDRKEITKIVKA